MTRAVNAEMAQAAGNLIRWVSKAAADHAFDQCVQKDGWSRDIDRVQAAIAKAQP